MHDPVDALRQLIEALERRTDGLTGRQFEQMVSPAMGAAFVKGWHALGKNPDDLSGEWLDMADTFAEIEGDA